MEEPCRACIIKVHDMCLDGGFARAGERVSVRQNGAAHIRAPSRQSAAATTARSLERTTHVGPQLFDDLLS
jgi:hypothetical protein